MSFVLCFSTMNTARHNYIDILSELADRYTPEPSDPSRMRTAVLSGELIEAGYLSGQSFREAGGLIRGSAITGLTVSGRLFLDQLRKEEREASLWAHCKRWGIPVITYLFGILTPVLSNFLKVIFHVKP
jgi:hypothetical protein